MFALLRRTALADRPVFAAAVTGLLFGGGAFGVMLAPIALGEGLIFDARGVILTLAPIFGGPIAGLLAGAVAAAGRLWIGGDGAAMGLLAVVIATGAGFGYRWWHRGAVTAMPGWHFLVLGLLVHLVTAACFPVVLPVPGGWRALSEMGPAMVLVGGPATWLLAFILQVFESQRQQALAIADERAQLRVNLDRMATVIESFPGAVSLFSADQRLVVANDAFYRMFAYPRERFGPGAAMADMLRFAAANGSYGRVDADSFVDAQLMLARNAQSVSAERERDDGTVIEERMHAVVTGGCMFMHQDITERRRHEAGLQLRNAQLQGIREIESAYISGADRNQIFEPMLSVILDLTESEHGFVAEVVRQPDGDPDLAIRAKTVPGPDDSDRPRDLLVEMLAEGETIILNESASGGPLLAMPVRSGDEIVGVLAVAGRAGGYDASIVELLRPLTHACGLVMAGMAARAAREQAEAAMQESAARLELAVRAGNIGIWIWEFATDRMYFSPEWKGQLGYEDDEIGDSHQEWVGRLHPEDAERTLATTRRFIADPWPGFTVEFRLRHKDGSYRWILAQASLSYGDDGLPARMMGTHIDMTSHKEAERELAREANRRVLLFDNAPDGMCVMDGDLAVVEVNPSFAAMLGMEREEVVGLHPWDWSVSCPTRDSLVAAFPQPLAEPVTFITRMRRKDGSEFDAEVTSVPADWAGEGSIFNVCRDITERTRAEARLRELSTAVEQSPASIVITDADGLIKYVNPRYEEITGYRGEEVIGKVPRILRPGVLPEEERQALTDAIAAGGVWRGEFRSVRKSGEDLWEMGSVSPIRSPDGQVTNLILIREDISRSKAIEEQLRQSQKMEAIGQLTAGMAHDFNNLLAIMVGNLELAVEATTDQVVQDKVATALRAANRGAALTRQLLAFGRRAPLMPQPTDLGELVAELEPLLRRTLGAGIDVVTCVEPGIGTVMIDRNQMENAILNLAINARDAMPGGGTLTIETSKVALDEPRGELGAGAYGTVVVSDNGIGMAPDVVAHAFEPFFTTKSVGKGSGLGLSMVYGFVKQSGGHARIFSEPGCGTSVKLYLPLSVQPARSARITAPATKSFATPGRERILVLENDDDVREAIASQLRSLGYNVVSEHTGSGAISLLDRGEEVDLLLSDVVLEGVESGPEVAVQVRDRRPGIKVVFMSGYPERAAAAGRGITSADRVLQKPISRVELAMAIRRELGNDSG